MKCLSASWNVWKNNIEENIVKGISFLEPCVQMWYSVFMYLKRIFYKMQTIMEEQNDDKDFDARL